MGSPRAVVKQPLVVRRLLTERHVTADDVWERRDSSIGTKIVASNWHFVARTTNVVYLKPALNASTLSEILLLRRPTTCCEWLKGRTLACDDRCCKQDSALETPAGRQRVLLFINFTNPWLRSPACGDRFDRQQLVFEVALKSRPKLAHFVVYRLHKTCLFLGCRRAVVDVTTFFAVGMPLLIWCYCLQR